MLQLQLDFMRRQCTFDTFMSWLGQCISMWDPEDIEALVAAKKSELEAMDKKNQKDDDVFLHINGSEPVMY